MKRTVILTSIAALAIGLGAAAATASPFWGKGHGGHQMRGPQITFEELDLDKNGTVTKEEFAGHAKARFVAADTDKDGFLSADELKARAEEQMRQRMGQGMARMIERRDTDKDGKLSFEEMQPNEDRAAWMFDRLDQNEDGAVSAEEFSQMQDRRGPGFMGRGDGKSMRDGRMMGQGWMMRDGARCNK